MKERIYIVSTYYHALITCIKRLNNNETADVLVTDYIPEGKELSERLEKSGLFVNVFFVSEVSEYKPKNRFDFIFNQHRKNVALIESRIEIDLRNYKEINIYHDDTWVARYLKDAGIKYRLIEDALDSFRIISDTCFSYMLSGNRIKRFLKRTLGIGYVFCGYDKSTVEVEVNDIKDIQISSLAKGKLVEVPRKPMFDALSENDKKILCDIFMKDIPLINPENSTLLLTQPLLGDGIVGSEEEQIKIYKELVSENIKTKTLVIKPHPRDSADYSPVFPSAVILDKDMPVEVMLFSLKGEFADVLSINSTSKEWVKNCNKE